MLGFFKNLLKGKKLLQHWHIPGVAGYERVNNSDSVQFINEDESRILYFSALIVKDSPVFSAEMLAKADPAITLTEHGWQLKGVRQGKDEILVCVFTFTHEDDKAWAIGVFTSVEYIGE
jgi:hypothetical protein